MSLDNKRCCPTDAPPAACRYTPEGDGMYMAGPIDAKAGILLVGDIFGMHPNSKRTADELGKAGYLVVMPDFLGERAWPESSFPPASFEDPEWVAFYTFISDLGLHRPRALRALDLLRRLKVRKVAVLGLCWGSVLAMRLAAEKLVDVTSVAHPSLLTADAVKAVQTPLCILAAMDDKGMDEVRPAVDALPVKCKLWKQYDSLHHGFLAARFDFANASSEELAQRSDAFRNLLSFYEETLC